MCFYFMQFLGSLLGQKILDCYISKALKIFDKVKLQKKLIQNNVI